MNNLMYGKGNQEISDILFKLGSHSTAKQFALLENMMFDIAGCRDPDKNERLKIFFNHIKPNNDGIETTNYKKVEIVG